MAPRALAVVVALTFPTARPRVRRGKRKRAKPPPKKAKPKVAQIFDCPFCGKKDACGCKMDQDHAVGTILCDGCGAKYEMRINRLTDPIDVYSEWIDMSEAVNRDGGQGVPAAVRRGEDEDEGDDGEHRWHGEEDADQF